MRAQEGGHEPSCTCDDHPAGWDLYCPSHGFCAIDGHDPMEDEGRMICGRCEEELPDGAA